MKKRLINLLNVIEVLDLHEKAIRFGGASGVMDKNKLESAVDHPLKTIKYGSKKQQEISYLAAVYFFHIIKNHPFVDGNKRTGVFTTIDFIYRNNYELNTNLDDLYQLAIDTAASKKSKDEIAFFFKKTIKKISKQQRLI